MDKIVTDEEARKIAARASGDPDVKVLEHEAKPFFAKRNAGMNGDFYSLKIKVETKSTSEKPDRSELKFFAKTPAKANQMRDFVDPEVSRAEFEFFERVYPLLRNDGWSPRCYLAKSELLVLEDLRERGFAPSPNSMYSVEQTKAALTTLALFHASSILAGQERLTGAADRLFREKTYTDDSGPNGRANRLGFETLALVAERLGFGSAREQLARVWELVKGIVKPVEGGCNVVCHADLWRTNVLFAESSDEGNESPKLKCLLVDYQMLRYASPCTDVAMLLYAHCTPEFRRNSELEMLDHYAQSLRAILEGVNSKIVVPTREELGEEYRRCRLLGMVCVATRWPRVVFERVLNDPVALERWYRVSRIDVYQRAMDEDPGYREGLRQCLEELFEEARRLSAD